jgi:LacI family transcriptional regulator
MANIKDVAKLAGVSPGTVSRALNGKSYVKSETRERILNAIKQLDYKPNTVAQTLKAGYSHSIALVIPNIENPIFPSITKGVEAVANGLGYMTILCNTGESIEREKKYIQSLMNRAVDGFIFATLTDKSNHIYELHQKGVPVVLLMRSKDDLIDSVIVDNVKVAYDATKYLASTGCRKIAYAMGDQSLKIYQDRFKGYMDALRDLNIPFHPELVMYESGSEESLYGVTRNLVSGLSKPDAILASTDNRAIIIMRALHDFGIKIPDDISVMGIDNIPVGAMVEPPLSTVAQPLYQMGSLAANKLISLIRSKRDRNNMLPPEVDVVKTEIIIRQSTR